MMPIPIDVIATFNTMGQIKPNFIRVEDQEHTLQTVKIEQIESRKEENYGGAKAEVFVCQVMLEEAVKTIRIRYSLQTHQWVLLNEYCY